MNLRLVASVAGVAALLLALPTAAHADVVITPVCTTSSAGPCSTGWYTSDVTISFSLSGSGFTIVDGCGTYSVTSDTADYPAKCYVNTGGDNVVGKLVHVKRDATPPNANAIAAARAPDVNGWYNHAVGVSVTGSDATSGIASCTAVSYTGPDSGSAAVTGNCRDNAGNVSGVQTLTFKYDGTAPSVTPAPARGTDSNGWYNHPVDVAFKGSDATSGIDSCTSASYSGPDSGGASVSGTCRDAAGNDGTAAFAVQYDATPPSVSGASPDRGPDVDGWYNHAVVVTFAGSDGTSGIAACDSVTYEKPDGPNASVSGRCRDKAGNMSAPGTFALKFDSTPPKLAEVAASALDRSVLLRWKSSADVARLTIARGATTVYAGKPIPSFVDKELRNGVRYRYTVTGADAAGNAVARKAAAKPSPPLIAPRAAARVRGTVVLRWRPARKATYYNVQLWLRGVKILTQWPSSPSFRVPYRLAPGRYVWHVWPGLGRRAEHRFGPPIGTSSFVVTR